MHPSARPAKSSARRYGILMGLTADALHHLALQASTTKETSLKGIASQQTKSFVELIKFKVGVEDCQ